MKRPSKKIKTPKTGSPVLDAWALAAQLEEMGVDVWGALDEINGHQQPKPNPEPPLRISSEGIPIIARGELQGMPPERVAGYFYDRVLSAAMDRNDDYIDHLRRLPQNWRLTYSVFWLQTEVDNGGIEQFFSNGQGHFDDETEADLRLLGSRKFLNLFTKARRLIYSAPEDRTERLPEIEPIDRAFYKKVNLYTLVGDFVLGHLEDYCAD